MPGIDDIAPSAIGAKGAKGSGKKGRKGSKGKGGGSRSAGFFSNFNMSNGKRAAAILLGAVGAEYINRKWGATISEKLGIEAGKRAPVGLGVAALGLVAASQKFVPAHYRDLAQMAALGAVIPTGITFAQSQQLLPPVAGVGDVEGYDDVEGYGDDDGSGLISIGNVGDLDDVGATEEVKALRIARKIAKARAKGKDKRLGRLEGKASKKGYVLPTAAAPRGRRFASDRDGDGVADRFDRDVDGDGILNGRDRADGGARRVRFFPRRAA